jgi:hypothetical protein
MVDETMTRRLQVDGSTSTSDERIGYLESRSTPL